MTAAIARRAYRGAALAHRGVTRIAHVRRYSEIVSVLAAGRRVLSALGRAPHDAPTRARRLRLTFEELGPTFIKFGRALSIHADLLPPDVVAELTLLQDAVACVSRSNVVANAVR